MTWLFFALLGYFLYALVTVSNKFLLRQRVTTKPLVFTFWISLLGLFAFALAPFGLHWPGWGWLAFDIISGLIYFVGLYAYYKALDLNEASRSASLVGALMPIFVLAFSYYFLHEILKWGQLLAFILLLIGGVLISFEKIKTGFKEKLKGLSFIAVSIIFQAGYYVMLKQVFNYQDFITGFIWSRLGLVAAALAVLLYPAWRGMIFSATKQATAGIGSLVLGSKFMAGLGSFFVSLAIARGPVSLVNAFQGSQYAFLFLFTVLLSLKFPKILREKLSRGIIAQKIAAIILICAGLALVAI